MCVLGVGGEPVWATHATLPATAGSCTHVAFLPQQCCDLTVGPLQLHPEQLSLVQEGGAAHYEDVNVCVCFGDQEAGQGRVTSCWRCTCRSISATTAKIPPLCNGTSHSVCPRADPPSPAPCTLHPSPPPRPPLTLVAKSCAASLSVAASCVSRARTLSSSSAFSRSSTPTRTCRGTQRQEQRVFGVHRHMHIEHTPQHMPLGLRMIDSASSARGRVGKGDKARQRRAPCLLPVMQTHLQVAFPLQASCVV